ncbi:MAG: hypothetical protein KJ824_12110 [Alphaproteobacteria bacterium]|nr:hypothetical protein [Alphaproteobacteria bacterium]
MTRFATVFAITALAASAAVPALAQHAQQTRFPSQAPATAQRVVMMCDNDAATRSSFRREHGADPVFVTAEQALHARATGESWAAPRCMTEREHGRLVQTLTAYASVR